MKVKILSIRQPWAWLIVNRHKPVENREWPSGYRGKLYIHAGKTMTKSDYEACKLFMAGFTDLQIPPMEELERGGIVGSAWMDGHVTRCDSEWFTGPYGFVMRDAKALPFRLLKGMLGLFTAEVPDDYY